MMTGTGAATFPTSSSVCIIFFIRAYKRERNKRFFSLILCSPHKQGFKILSFHFRLVRPKNTEIPRDKQSK